MPRNIYKLKSGEIVPGVTTIVNQLGKGESLLNWAWECGKKGKDWKEERDSAGDIGTLVHEKILSFLQWEALVPIDPEFFGTKDVWDLVDKIFDKFVVWWNEQEFILQAHRILEQPLVSEKYGFGGQLDIYLPNSRRLIDIKTSGGIYESYWYQLAGYDILLRENGYKVDGYQILWLPKDDRFDCPIRKDLRREKRIFKDLLKLYKDIHGRET